MDTLTKVLLIRFGLLALGLVLLALLAVAVLMVLKRVLRSPESRQRASSLVRAAPSALDRRGSGGRAGVVSTLAHRAADRAAGHLENGPQ